jgi:hypothetical protein
MTPSWVYNYLHAHAECASEGASPSAGSLCNMFAGSKTLQCSAGSTAQHSSSVVLNNASVSAGRYQLKIL